MLMNGFTFPVYVHEAGQELPKDGTFFVVAGNGLWIHKDNGVVRGFSRVDQISILEDLNVEAHSQFLLPKIPARDVWRIKTFFKAVVDKHRAESNTLLYYNKETKDWKVVVTEQSVTHGSVRYVRQSLAATPELSGYLMVGTIHSHCDFQAFHSGTDHDDEEFFDGLHCTFGHNDQDVFTISATTVMNGQRTKIDPMTVLEGIEHIGGDRYQLQSVSPEVADDWAQGVPGWLDKVNGGTGFF